MIVRVNWPGAFVSSAALGDSAQGRGGQMAEVSDDQLLRLIVEADDLLLNEGVAPGARSIQIAPKVMTSLGYRGFTLAGAGAPPIVQRILALHGSLYRRSDFAIGGIHGGIFMFRDVFARITVPVIYGRAAIEPFKLIDLSEQQIKWLCSREQDMQAFLDQFIDIFDFAGGVGDLADFKTPPPEAQEVFTLAAFQLQAAGAALRLAFDFRGATQSALIGVELAIKAGLAAAGADEQARRAHGHNLASAAKEFGSTKPGFDLGPVLN